MEETARIAGEEPKNSSVLSQQGGVKKKAENLFTMKSSTAKIYAVSPEKVAILPLYSTPLAETGNISL